MHDQTNNELIKQIHYISLENNIPIVRQETIKHIIDTIIENEYTSVLEIGTALGYSSAMIAINTKAKVTTLEKDEIKFSIAKNVLKSFGQIQCVNIDCLQYNDTKQYDLIFIDGPKSHQIQIFEQYILNLAPRGTIIIDNIYLRKIANLTLRTSQQEKLLQKIKLFREYLLNHSFFTCKILEMDDGIAIMTRKD